METIELKSTGVVKTDHFVISDLPFDPPFKIVIRPKQTNRRTLSQNAALHLYCDMIAQAMTEAGITQRELIGRFKRGFELPVTGHMIKAIFREVGRAMYGKESTADLSTTEISEVYRVVDERFGEVTGVTCPWPDGRGGI